MGLSFKGVVGKGLSTLKKTPAGQIAGFGLGLLKGKDIGPDPEAALIKAFKIKGLRSISEQLDEAKKAPTGEAVARLGVGRELKELVGARADTERNLRGTIARRGLGSTGAQLAQGVGISRRFAETGANIRASLPERIQEQRLARSQRIAGLGGQLSGQVGQIPLRFQKTRKPGLGGLIGTLGGAALGGFFGGPAGAGVGAQIGGGLGQTLSA